MEKVRTLYFANFKSSKSKCGVIFFNFSPVAEIYVISHFDNISAFCFKNKMPLYANLEYFYTVFDICTFTQYPALHFDLFLL